MSPPDPPGGGMTTPNPEDFRKELDRVARGECDLLEARRIVLAGLDHRDVEIRRRAAASGWHLFDDEVVTDRLMRIAASDEDPEVRGQCLIALGRVLQEGSRAGFGDAPETGGVDPETEADPLARRFVEVFDLAYGRLEDETEALEVRRRALEALGNGGGNPRTNRWIRVFAESPDPDARVSAAYAMGATGDVRWERRLWVLLDDPVEDVRIEAMRAAGWLRLESMRDRIASRCLDPRPQTAVAAAEAIADLVSLEDAYRFLREVLPRVTPGAREEIRRILEEVTYSLLVPREEYDDNGHDTGDALL